MRVKASGHSSLVPLGAMASYLQFYNRDADWTKIKMFVCTLPVAPASDVEAAGAASQSGGGAGGGLLSKLCPCCPKFSSKLGKSVAGSRVGILGGSKVSTIGGSGAASKADLDDGPPPPTGKCECLRMILCCSRRGGKCCSCCKKADTGRRKSDAPSRLSKKASRTSSTAVEIYNEMITRNFTVFRRPIKNFNGVKVSKDPVVGYVGHIPEHRTLTSGLFCLCFGKSRFQPRDDPQGRCGSFVVNVVVGAAQLFTVIFCLVGWGWSIWWGVIMIRIAKKYRKLKLAEAANQQDNNLAAPVTQQNHDVERGRPAQFTASDFCSNSNIRFISFEAPRCVESTCLNRGGAVICPNHNVQKIKKFTYLRKHLSGHAKKLKQIKFLSSKVKFIPQGRTKMSKRKAPASENNPNHDFCEFLMELANYEKNVSRNIYKYNAYRNAANIREDDTTTAINLLTRVSGIGPAKAKELVDANIRTIEDLSKNKSKLNHHQLIGLKYFNMSKKIQIESLPVLKTQDMTSKKHVKWQSCWDQYFEDFEKKIPRKEIHQIEEIVKEEINNLDSDYLITVCGSYRRGKAESGDIDILLTHPSYTSKDGNKKKSHLLKKVVDVLQSNNLIIDTISLGDVKFMGVCRKGKESPARRLDIRLTPNDQYYCSILYFTGSDLFNKNMRAHALEHGYTLNEYTLRHVDKAGVAGDPVNINSEEDIFDYIGYPYKKPAERDI
ncbi:hypothetical protein C0J52_13269 [Blattella germanica]|nr:hypothetical protein C0J52_13269 [Blattella germanica]